MSCDSFRISEQSVLTGPGNPQILGADFSSGSGILKFLELISAPVGGYSISWS